MTLIESYLVPHPRLNLTSVFQADSSNSMCSNPKVQAFYCKGSRVEGAVTVNVGGVTSSVGEISVKKLV